MAYDNNVPQANQTIAQTQPIINANFAYIQQHLQDEHDFNGNVPAAVTGVHKQASMPNRIGGDPVALPAGTNGMYYVNGGIPKFYNGITAYVIPIATSFTTIVTGTVALINSASPVITLPAFSAGTYYFTPPSGDASYAAGQFVTTQTLLNLVNTGSSSDPGILLSVNGLQLKAAVSAPGDYKFIIQYTTP